MQPVAGPGSDIPQVARLLLVATGVGAVIDLSLVDLSATDTIMINDTGANGPVVLTLPKIGSWRAPVGLRLSIRKSSVVANAIVITPQTLDAISAATGTYPSIGAAGAGNGLTLVASHPNDITLEATNLAPIGAAGAIGYPNAAPGTPTLGGIWMRAAGSTPSL